MPAASTGLRTVPACLLFLCLASASSAWGNTAISDTDVSDKIEEELLVDPAVMTDSIDIETNQGIVTLTGSVSSILAMERAARIAETVRGVRAVVNRLEVIPVSAKSAEALHRDIVTALAIDPVTESYAIETSVDAQGHVTLIGSVDSWGARDLAETVVKGVSGVTGVSNNVEVMFRAERPDNEIMPEIQRRMHWDTLLDGTQVDVRVRDGMVFLSGTVGSAAEVSRAELDAMVGGVEAVDSSGLVVAKWARDEQMRKQKYLPRSDFAIRDAVLDALSYDPRLATLDIDAKVTAGKVVLKGVVDNIQARRAAQQDARNTVGVVWVENLIKIRPVEQLDAARIAENVRGELQRNPFTENHDIEVSVRNGVVYLDGSVETSFEKVIAENIAFRARGVTRVRNNLVVGFPENIGYNPYVYQWSIHDYPWYETTTLTLDINDKQIARKIRDELFWSPFVDSDDVAVSMEDGVATLTGTVGSLGEYRAARENAYEGGALRVRNRLQLE